MPRTITPLVVNMFVKENSNKIVLNHKELLKIIDDFKIFVEKVTDEKFVEFLTKGNEKIVY